MSDDDGGATASPGPVLPTDQSVPGATDTETGMAPHQARVRPAKPGPHVVAVREGMFGSSGPGDTSGFGGMVTTIAMPGESARPYGGWFDEAVDVLAEVLNDSAGAGSAPDGGFDAAIERVVVDRGELTLYVRAEHLVPVAQALRDDPDLRFEMCLGVSGVHYPAEPGRELHAVYPLKSITHRRRIRLEVACAETDPHIPSLTSVYPSNNWHERETWDFFGIIFDGHPALTRIEMPDDWLGHPQRKDYPLGGIPVEYKGATIPPPDTRREYR